MNYKELVSNQKLSHAYMLEGIHRSVLKQEAMTFAQQILCQDDICHSRVEQMNHADFYWLESDEQTIKKEMIEEVLHRMNQKPIEGDYKVYVIVDFDKVTIQGENAILKFLEEPPPNTIALLLTTKPNDILPTIHSRCQHLHYKNADEDILRNELIDCGIHPDIAATFASLSIVGNDAMIWSTEKEFAEIRSAMVKWADILIKDPQMALIQIVEMMQSVKDRESQLIFLDMLQLYFQDILYIKIGRTDHLSFPEHQAKLENTSSRLSLNLIVKWIDISLEGKRKLLQYVNTMLVFEQIAIRTAKEVSTIG